MSTAQNDCWYQGQASRRRKAALSVSGIPITDMWLFSAFIYSAYSYPLFGRNVPRFMAESPSKICSR